VVVFAFLLFFRFRSVKLRNDHVIVRIYLNVFVLCQHDSHVISTVHYTPLMHQAIHVLVQAVRMCLRNIVEGALDEHVAGTRVQVQYARVRGYDVLVERQSFRERTRVHEQVLVRPLKGNLLGQSAGPFNDHLTRALDELDVQSLAQQARNLRDDEKRVAVFADLCWRETVIG
jgi:hypothetical protein